MMSFLLHRVFTYVPCTHFKSLPFLRVGSTSSRDVLGRVEKSIDRGSSEVDKIDSVSPQKANSTAILDQLPVSPRNSLQSVTKSDLSTNPLSLDPPSPLSISETPPYPLGSTSSGDALGRDEKSIDRGSSEVDKIDSVSPQRSNSTAILDQLPVSPRNSLQSMTKTDLSTDLLSLDPPSPLLTWQTDYGTQVSIWSS